MAKFLSALTPAWSKCLLVLPKRSYGKSIKGSWNQSPTCDGRQTNDERKTCYPKESSCYANLCACPIYEWPKCGEPNAKPAPHLSCCCDLRLTENPCEKPKRKIKKQEEEKPFKSMWEVDGFEKQCPDFNPRVDDTHYVSSDKTKRIYTQTWESCGPVIRKRKVCCVNDMCMLPPQEKRAKQECPQTAKEQNSEQLKIDYNVLRKCLNNVIENPNTKRINKCRKVVMPCCRKVAKSTKCHRNRGHSKCIKDCCPHPSFSECDHLQLKQKSLSEECRCSHLPNQCETDRFLIRKHIFQLPPALPAWPVKERPK